MHDTKMNWQLNLTAIGNLFLLITLALIILGIKEKLLKLFLKLIAFEYQI